MDPEFATETVKLFAQELKVVRAENDNLKADNAVLQERIARLQDELTQVSSIKSEEGLVPIPLQYAEVVTPTAAGRPRTTTNMLLFSRCLP